MTLTQIKLIGLVILLGVSIGGTWHFTKNYYTNKYDTQIAKLDKDHAKQVKELTDSKIVAERKLGESRNEIDVEHNKTIDELTARIDTLRRDNVRLRDPGAKASSCPSTNSGTTSGSADGDETEGLLSRQATEFLWGFAGEADRVNEELRACRKWVDDVRRITEAERIKQEADQK